jgi:cytochrome c oxidase subunit 1
MPRRIPDYALQFTDFNQWSTVGAFLLGFSQILLLVLVVKTIRGGKKATSQVWDSAEGLEWTLPSPPPFHSFVTPPKVK